MTNLGQVAALLTRSTLPATELPVIIRKVDGQGDFEDFYLWQDGAWRSFTFLFGAVSYGTSAPSDTSKVWLDTNFTPPIIKTYDAAAQVWKDITQFRSLDFDSNFTVQPSHHNAAINIVNTTGRVDVTIVDHGMPEYVLTISRITTDPVNVVSGPGVQLNGAVRTIGIANQWRSALVRKIDTDKFIVEGNLL